MLYYLAPCKHLPTHNAITPHITGLVVLLGLEVLGRVAHEGDVYLLILGDIVVVFRYFLRRYECWARCYFTNKNHCIPTRKWKVVKTGGLSQTIFTFENYTMRLLRSNPKKPKPKMAILWPRIAFFRFFTKNVQKGLFCRPLLYVKYIMRGWE